MKQQKMLSIATLSAVFFLSIFPIVLNFFGIDFSSHNLSISSSYSLGSLHHLILEWSAVSIAIITVIATLFYYYSHRDIAVPLLGLAIFCAGIFDAFHALAATELINASVDESEFTTFTWALSRLFNSFILVAGMTILLIYERFMDKYLSKIDNKKRDIYSLLLIAVVFVSITMFVIFQTLNSESLPKTVYEHAVVTRPFDIIPLALYILAGALILGWYKSKRSWLKLALMASLIPQVVTQVVMAFFTSALYDNFFNIGHIIKVFAYLCILLGILIEIASSKNNPTYSQKNIVKKSNHKTENELEVGVAKYPQVLIFPAVIFIVSLFVVGIVAYSFYLDSRDFAIQQEVEELELEGQLIKPLLKELYQDVQNDVQFISHTPPIQGIINSVNKQDDYNYSLWVGRLQQIFMEQLRSKSKYLGVSYLKIKDIHYEIVSARRVNGRVVVVPFERLKKIEKDDFFSETVTLGIGEYSFSHIKLKRTNGVIDLPYLPVLRVATPIFDQRKGEIFGIIILDIDINQYFKKIRLLLREKISFYLTNNEGYYIYHPDMNKTFGFETGKNYLIQEEFPELKPFLLEEVERSYIETSDYQKDANNKNTITELAGYYERVDLNEFGSKHFLRFLLTIEKRKIEQALKEHRDKSLLLGVALAFISLAFAIIVSRRLINPLQKMTDAITHYDRHDELPDLPVKKLDEVGVLARSFHNMILVKQIRDQELREQKFALDQHADVAVTDRHGVITFANQRFSDVSEYEIEELIGNDHRCIKSGYHSDEFFKEMYTTLNTGMVWHGEICNKNKSGALYWVDATIVPFKNNNNEIVSFIAIRTDISDRRYIETELKKSRDQFVSLVKNIPGVTVRSIFKEEHEILFVSEQVAQLTGYLPFEFQSGRVQYFDLIDNKYKDLVKNEILNGINKKVPWNLEYEIKHKNGGMKWVLEKGKASYDEYDDYLFIDCFVSDITEIKQAEQNTNEAHMIQNAVLEFSDNGLLVTNDKNELIKTNKQFLELWDITQEDVDTLEGKDLLNKAIKNLKEPEKFIETIVELSHDYETERSDTFDFNDGRIYERYTKPFYIQGKGNFRIWSFRDFTVRLAASRHQKELLEASQVKLAINHIMNRSTSLEVKFRESLGEIFELECFAKQRKACVFIMDEDKKSLNLMLYHGDFSDTYLAQCNNLLFDEYVFEEVISSGELKVIDNNLDSNSFYPKLPEFENTGSYFIPLISQSTNERIILGVMMLISDVHPENNTLRINLLNETADIMALNILNEKITKQLEIARQKAEESNRLKSEFLASMSHEIRTPMNGVIGMLSLLMNSQLTENQKHKAELAQSSAKSLLTLINDILDFSKVDAGKMELELIDFDLKKMITNFAQSIEFKAKEKDVEIILDLTEVSDFMVKGDPGRLRQILTNLVSNAIKFTEAGEVFINARLAKSKDDRLRFDCSVVDTGIGIPLDVQKKLFSAFVQADTSTTRKYGGTGLGLSIVKKLCELMGGGVEVNSQPGRGSTFKFHIYLEHSDLIYQTIPNVSLEGVDVLVVDDNMTNREVLSGYLDGWGVNAVEAVDAKNAIEICEERYAQNSDSIFQIAILDMQMPDMDGAELGSFFKSDKRFEKMKLIMMTSMNKRGDAKFFAEHGFSAYFPKPISCSDVYDALAIVLSEGEGLSQAKPLVTHHYLNSLRNKNSKHSLSYENILQQKKVKWPQELKILLVEDNHVNQEVAKGILREFSLTINIAGNGEEALQTLKNSDSHTPYTLILMDCQMPIMDGYTATKKIRNGEAGEHYKDIVIVSMTANAMKGDKENCIAAGMDQYVAKPVDPAALFDVISRYFEPYPLDSSNLDENIVTDELHDVEPELSSSQDDFDQNEILVWDKNSLLKRVLGKESLVQKMIELFLSDAPQQVRKISHAIENSFIEEVAQSAHAIKGVAANISAIKVQQTASIIEEKARKGDKTELIELLEELKKQFIVLEKKLTEAINEREEKENKQPQVALDISWLILELEQLESKLLAGDYIDIEELDVFNSIESTPEVERALKALINQISIMDIEGALAILKELRLQPSINTHIQQKDE